MKHKLEGITRDHSASFHPRLMWKHSDQLLRQVSSWEFKYIQEILQILEALGLHDWPVLNENISLVPSKNFPMFQLASIASPASTAHFWEQSAFIFSYCPSGNSMFYTEKSQAEFSTSYLISQDLSEAQNPLLELLAVPLLIQPSMWMALIATRVHCWLL